MPDVSTVHEYLSTGCLHGRHDYCAAMTGYQGTKRAARCKFCDAACICECHGQTMEGGTPDAPRHQGTATGMIPKSYVLIRHTNKDDTACVLTSMSEVMDAVVVCLVECAGVPRPQAGRFARLLVKAPCGMRVAHPCGYAFTVLVTNEEEVRCGE
jgi:hypothetical protein